MKPARGLLLVRPIDAEDTIGGGAIVVPDAAKARMTAHQCEVVTVGAPEICEDRKCRRGHPIVIGCNGVEERMHDYPFQRGDWLLVRPRSFINTDAPERKLWLVRQNDVLAIIVEDQ